MFLREGSNPACHHAFHNLPKGFKEGNRSPSSRDRIVLFARLPQGNSGGASDMGWVIRKSKASLKQG
jgi:hypothetical protein